MKKLEQRVREAAERIQPHWTPDRSRRLEERLLARAKVAERPRRLAWAVAVVGAVATGWVLLADPGAWRSTPGPTGDTAVHLPDGSMATLLSPTESAVWITEARPDALVVSMRGRAKFDVVKDPRRIFRVEAGPVAVEVLGTRFRVEMEAERTRVTVDEGRVRVVSAYSSEELGAGHSALFPREAPRTGPAPLPDTEVEPSGLRKSRGKGVGVAPARETAVPPPKTPDWKALAEQGDYEAAYAAYTQAASLPGDPRSLMLAADVARFSRHPADALPPLERLLETSSSDPMAPLAAFTLGRVLLDDLGHPREAAGAFERAVELAPNGPLAEDALARGVESWSRAGDEARARRLAEDYLDRHPKGRRTRAVRRFGGLD